MKETIIEKTRRRLIESGASQPVIARACGVSQSTVGRIMRGDVTPSGQTLQRLIDWLGPDHKRRGRKPRYLQQKGE